MEYPSTIILEGRRIEKGRLSLKEDLCFGFLEMEGFVPMIEALDVMLKTSSVSIVACEKVGAGLLAVTICGDLAAVKEAINEGVGVAKRFGSVTSLVLPDLSRDVKKVLGLGG